MLGSPLRILPESILGEDMDLEWDEIESWSWTRRTLGSRSTSSSPGPWESSAGRYPVSHGTLVGPSDLAGVVRGRNRNIFDMYDEPEKSSDLLWKTARIFVEVLEGAAPAHTNIPWRIFGAQYPTVDSPDQPSGCRKTRRDYSLRNSTAASCSRSTRGWPAQYSHNFIHLHSTSMHILDCFLEIEELRCFQVNNDVSGPPH